ncbi:MAG: RdgB/HAM1 family non-canonical purine NTP pyrophosphatase [Firmicutes bacterium]|nr:RdgB/HAM1 family non-canonical purine NTP pyrophosphatase [Bacillota bacterium]
MKLETLIVATGNKHKLQEIQEIFKDVRVVSAREAGYTGDPEETGATFEENAVIKARAAAEALNLPALADDSGLCVAALGGAPGIYSARYAGGHGDDKKNREKLLAELGDEKNRAAYFRSAAALCFPQSMGGKTVTATGDTHGRILTREEGENGFGYDCLFYSDDLCKSFGVASAEEKNAVSHRFRALTALKEKLKSGDKKQ